MKKDDLKKIAQPLIKELTKFSYFSFLVTKGKSEDIIDCRSDLDFRIIVKTANYELIEKINNSLYKTYLKIIGVSCEKFRIFEHPPLILSFDQLLSYAGNANEIATWEFIGGDKHDFKKISELYRHKLVSNIDIDRYKEVLSSKKNYDVNGELFYPHLNLEVQKRYCLVWHYYATSVYVFMSIYSGKRLSGKSEGLKMAKKYFPNLVFTDKKKLLNYVEDKKVDSKQLERELKKEIGKLLKYKPLGLKITSENNSFFIFQQNAYFLALYLNKISRLLIYLDKNYLKIKFSKQFSKNLAIREIEDVQKIYRGFVNILGYLQYNENKEKYIVKKLSTKLDLLKNILLSAQPNRKFLSVLLSYFKENLSDFLEINLFIIKIYANRT